MDFFISARNFFSNGVLPQQASWSMGLLLLSLVAIVAGWVLIRRSFGAPRIMPQGASPPAGQAFERYELMGRFWHWSLFGMILALLISGFVFYEPGVLPGPAPLIGVSWLWVHLFFGALFVIGIAFHSLHGLIFERNPGVVWFSVRDWREVKAKLRYYFSRERSVPKTGKFSGTNKLFHTSLALLGLLMAITGVTLSLDTLGWMEIDQNWHREQRVLHDIGTWGFIALLASHIFWQLLRGNLLVMFHGRIDRHRLEKEYDWDQWQPVVKAVPGSVEERAGRDSE